MVPVEGLEPPVTEVAWVTATYRYLRGVTGMVQDRTCPGLTVGACATYVGCITDPGKVLVRKAGVEPARFAA